MSKETLKSFGLFDFMELDEEKKLLEESEGHDWKEHWVGMPEFEQEENPPFKKINVSFRTQEDYDEFAKLIEQNLTEKTKSIWYPKLEKDENTLKRWFEE